MLIWANDRTDVVASTGGNRRKRLADLCRGHDPYDPAMDRMARKLESLGRRSERY